MLCLSEWFLLKRRILLSLSLWHIIIICALLALLTLSLVCFHCSVNFEKLWVKLSLVKEKETVWLFHFISLKQCSEINKMWVRVRVVWLRSHFPATMGQNMTPLLVWGSEMASWMLSVKCSEGSYSKHKLGLTVRFHISPYVNKSKSKPVREKLLSFGYICTEFPRELQLPSPKQKKLFRGSHLEGMAAAQVLSVGTDAWFGPSQCWAGEEPDVINRAVLQQGGLLWALCTTLSSSQTSSIRRLRCQEWGTDCLALVAWRPPCAQLVWGLTACEVSSAACRSDNVWILRSHFTIPDC